MASGGNDPGGFLSGLLDVIGPRLKEKHQQNLAKKAQEQQAQFSIQSGAKTEALKKLVALYKQSMTRPLTDQENQEAEQLNQQYLLSDEAVKKSFKSDKQGTATIQRVDQMIQHMLKALKQKHQSQPVNQQGSASTVQPTQQQAPGAPPAANEEALSKQGQPSTGATNGAQKPNQLTAPAPVAKPSPFAGLQKPGPMYAESLAQQAEPTDPNLLKLELQQTKNQAAVEAAESKKEFEELQAKHKKEKEELEARHKGELETQTAKDKAALEAQTAKDKAALEAQTVQNKKNLEAQKSKDAADLAAARAAAKPAKAAKAAGTTPTKLSEKQYVSGGPSIANPTGDMAIDGGAWIFIQNNGHLPFTGFGSGAKGGVNRRELMIARAGEILADLGLSFSDLPAIGGKIKGDTQALARVSSMGAMVKQFEGTLTANMETAKKLSDAWQRSDYPFVNRIVGAYKTGTGDPEALNLAAQLHGVAREWGKIMAGSVSASGVTVSEANAADLLLAKGISSGQLESFMKNVILPDVQNRTGAIEGERQRLIDSLRGDVKSTGGSNTLKPPPAVAGKKTAEQEAADYLKAYPNP